MSIHFPWPNQNYVQWVHSFKKLTHVLNSAKLFTTNCFQSVSPLLLDHFLVCKFTGPAFLKCKITGSKCFGSSRMARSLLVGLWPNIMQWTLWSPTSRWTIRFSSGSLRLFFGWSAASSKRLSPGLPSKKVLFLASKRDFKAWEADQLAFLGIAPPWMSWIMGRAVGLSFNHLWPSFSKISSWGMMTGFSPWKLICILVEISTMVSKLGLGLKNT